MLPAITGVVSQSSAVAPSGSQSFDSGSGNFIVPSGVTSITIKCWGAGGGGGFGLNDTTDGGGGGGGSGGYSEKTRACTAGESIAYSVGAFGAGAINSYNSPGANGGDTSCDGMVAGGGLGGQQAHWSNPGPGAGGAGGTATGGDTNINGNAGQAGTLAPKGGDGGNAPNGGTGGIGPSDISDPLWGSGADATAPGAGGGGAIGGSFGGGDGANGRVEFIWGS